MSNYIVSAQKPTVVNGCVVGNFRTEEEIDLIIARINRIELLLVTEEGLKPHREIPVFGRIALIQAFRPPGEVRYPFFLLFLFLEERPPLHSHCQISNCYSEL